MLDPQEDLTESQKLEALGRLAVGIAHDFHNLLTAILGYARLGLNETPLDSSAHGYFEEIERFGERASPLIRQLLAARDRRVVRDEVVDVGAIVRGLEPRLSALVGPDITLRMVTPDVTGPVFADAGQLEQVIITLATNAREAMSDGGTLTIEVADTDHLDEGGPLPSWVPDGPGTMLSVTDTGRGIDDETMSHVFEPFFTTKAPGEGHGLGLATAAGVAGAYGGTVVARSILGKGSTFTVLLPRRDGASV